MVDVRITLSGLWVAVMLTYLLGDVLRIFAGHFVAGEIQGKRGQSGDVAADRGDHADPDRHDRPVPDAPVSRDPLGDPRRGGALGALQSRRPALRRRLRQLPDRCEHRLLRADRLVRVDVAGSRLTATMRFVTSGRRRSAAGTWPPGSADASRRVVAPPACASCQAVAERRSPGQRLREGCRAAQRRRRSSDEEVWARVARRRGRPSARPGTSGRVDAIRLQDGAASRR